MAYVQVKPAGQGILSEPTCWNLGLYWPAEIDLGFDRASSCKEPVANYVCAGRRIVPAKVQKNNLRRNLILPYGAMPSQNAAVPQASFHATHPNRLPPRRPHSDTGTKRSSATSGGTPKRKRRSVVPAPLVT